MLFRRVAIDVFGRSAEEDLEPADEDYYTAPIKHLSAAQVAYVEAGVYYTPMHLMSQLSWLASCDCWQHLPNNCYLVRLTTADTACMTSNKWAALDVIQRLLYDNVKGQVCHSTALLQCQCNHLGMQHARHCLILLQVPFCWRCQ